MPIVKYKNQSGVEYAYEQTSFYDAEHNQSRPVRKYLGHVDPETGEIIKTTGKRGRPPKDPQAKKSGKESADTRDYKALYEQKCREADMLQQELIKTRAENDRLTTQAGKLKQVITAIREQVSFVRDL